jgi:uncharacterized membrane-anchored protein
MDRLIARIGTLLCVCAAAVSFTAAAQPTDAAQAEFAAAAQAANKAMLTGPADIKLLDQAVLKLPKDLAYIPAAEAARFLAAMGNRTGEGLLGMVLSPNPTADWFVVMRFAKAGYIKDDDAKDWKTDELLSGLKDGTEEANKDRRSRGMPEVEVLGWVEAPKYDSATHRLVWSLESQDKGAPAQAERGVNYNTYALGRDGYISMNLVTGMKQIQDLKPTAHALLASLHYNDGKKYGDFNSATDHIAEYGLAALVGGIAAKKLGLFALALAFILKFAKVIGIAVLAFSGVLYKVLTGRKRPDAAASAPSSASPPSAPAPSASTPSPPPSASTPSPPPSASPPSAPPPAA